MESAASDRLYMTDEQNQENIIPEDEARLPIGILRLREEWKREGLTPKEEDTEHPVVFPEPEAGGAIGDYLLAVENVRERLGLSEEALDRLITGGELDSILVKKGESVQRMISQTSLNRFLEDAGMDPLFAERRARAAETRELAEMIKGLSEELEQVKLTHARQMSQMKDMLLLELRNLKEQDRDLTSFVYELAEEIKRLLPKRKR
jgi:hypothetical protein